MNNSVVYMVMGFDPQHRDSIGVCKKIEGECKGIEELGYKTDILFIYQNVYTLINNNDRTIIRTGSLVKKNIASFVSELSCVYGTLYARSNIGNVFFAQIIKNAKKQGMNVIVEIPTYPIISEQIGKARNKFQNRQIYSAAKSLFAGFYLQYCVLPRICKSINCLAIVSSNQQVQGSRCVRIDNGVDFSAIERKHHNKHEKIVFLGVANTSYWHGYDRVLRGLAEYNKSDQIPDVEFRIVGKGDALPELKMITNELGIEACVTFVGEKFGADLDIEFDNADIAVGSLALHRKKLGQASSLKIREYTARGIPFVVSDVEFEDTYISKYTFCVKDDEEPIGIAEIIRWYDSINYSEFDSIEMREFAKASYQWKVQMEKLFKEVVE